MKDPRSEKPNVKSFAAVQRRAVTMTQEALVKTAYLQPGTRLPLAILPGIEGVDIVSWAADHVEFIERHLMEHGGILFRNFHLGTVSDFNRMISAVSGELLQYTYRSTPRKEVSDNIYTSTEYPADQHIPLHNEMAYSRNWPMKLWFLCVTPAEHGGETPIADSRKVFRGIDPAIRERFMQKGVMYVRTYGDALDLPWQDVFQTAKKTEVEDYCRTAGIEFEWREGDRLRTRQVCQAAATHPKTGDRVWFNQAHLFHVSSLEPAVRESFLSLFAEEDFPRNAYYGDGSTIENAALEAIREAYRQETISFPWRQGDVLLLDNMLTAHGRTPFVGPRKILVGMSERFDSQMT